LRPWIKALLVAVPAALAAPGALQAQELVTLPTRAGVTQPFFLLAPAGQPVASVILFPGGDGALSVKRGALAGGDNFLTRSRNRFAAQGFLVALLDVPSDHSDGYGAFRSTENHARDIAGVIAYLRQRAAVPVWLVGTSRGTISAANAAARLMAPEAADGLVLTSSITASSKRLLDLPASVDLAAITVPTLLVHNTEDQCVACPFSKVPGVMDKLTRVPRKELIPFTGGDPPQGDPCEALSRHGFLGIEDPVVAAIARWIKGS
jgi:predicted alpha/beta-hydrolase family hydrolase